MTIDRPFEGNQAKQMPGTCEACVWGRGMHSPDCTHWIVQALRSQNGDELHGVHMQLIRDYDQIFAEQGPKPLPPVTVRTPRRYTN